MQQYTTNNWKVQHSTAKNVKKLWAAQKDRRNIYLKGSHKRMVPIKLASYQQKELHVQITKYTLQSASKRQR